MKALKMTPISRFILSLLALNSNDDIKVVSSSSSTTFSSSCRSNSTHIAWNVVPTTTVVTDDSRRRKTSASTSTSSSRLEEECSYSLYQDAFQECMEYLLDNVMAFDVPFSETMGFPTSSEEEEEVDGLDNGMVGPTIRLALESKILYPWTDFLPKAIFLEYVLNYGNLNEARTNWRPLLVESLQFNASTVVGTTTANDTTSTSTIVSSVVTWVNTHLWSRLGRHERSIYFKSSQTPLIFDPMSTIAYGYASCTGTSILFCNALRSVGIAARVVGTPAWYGNRTQGNHNWVEVYVGDDNWKFLEPSPSLSTVDTIDTDPCQRWFCQKSRYPSTKVYAAQMTKTTKQQQQTTTHFPLAWEWDCQDVPAIDRTSYYTDICEKCESED